MPTSSVGAVQQRDEDAVGATEHVQACGKPRLKSPLVGLDKGDQGLGTASMTSHGGKGELLRCTQLTQQGTKRDIAWHGFSCLLTVLYSPARVHGLYAIC
jgi:hypothetical protein